MLPPPVNVVYCAVAMETQGNVLKTQEQVRKYLEDFQTALDVV
jgi:hypothetical protein